MNLTMSYQLYFLNYVDHANDIFYDVKDDPFDFMLNMVLEKAEKVERSSSFAFSQDFI